MIASKKHPWIVLAGVGAVALVLGVGILWAVRRPSNARVKLEQARIALANDNPAAALDFLRGLTLPSPVPTAVRWLQARALLQLGRLDEARAVAEATIAQHPDVPDGRRIAVQWAFARMDQAFQCGADDDFEAARSLCLRQADWLAERQACRAEAYLIRGCCAEARLRHLRRHDRDGEPLAPHRAAARRHARAALATDPTLWAAWELTADLLAPDADAEALWDFADRLSEQGAIPASVAHRYISAILSIPARRRPLDKRIELGRTLLAAVAPDERQSEAAQAAETALRTAAHPAEQARTLPVDSSKTPPAL